MGMYCMRIYSVFWRTSNRTEVHTVNGPDKHAKKHTTNTKKWAANANGPWKNLSLFTKVYCVKGINRKETGHTVTAICLPSLYDNKCYYFIQHKQIKVPIMWLWLHTVKDKHFQLLYGLILATMTKILDHVFLDLQFMCSFYVVLLYLVNILME